MAMMADFRKPSLVQISSPTKPFTSVAPTGVKRLGLALGWIEDERKTVRVNGVPKEKRGNILGKCASLCYSKIVIPSFDSNINII